MRWRRYGNPRPWTATPAARVAVAGILALVASGCVWVKLVSRPVPGPGAIGVYGRFALSANGRFVAFAADRDARLPGAQLGVFRLDTQTDELVLVSVATDGTPADDWSGEPSISADGRYVAFSSDAENLVPGDGNLATDVFVRDVTAGVTTRVSVSSTGVEADEDSYAPSISADGTRVAFTSDSDLLAPGDDNFSSDVFVRNRSAGTTVLASVTSGGNPAENGAWDGVISGNGRYVAFTTDSQIITSDQNDADDVYRKDLSTGSLARVSRSRSGNPLGGGGWAPSISTDGRYVAFTSDGTDLATTDTNGQPDVFVRDMTLTVSEVASLLNLGGQINQPSGAGVISGDGTRVAFVTSANASGTDTNGSVPDVFVRDRTAARTRLVSTDSSGTQTTATPTNPVLSPDGRYVAFGTTGAYVGEDANGLRDVYLRFVDEPKITGISPAVARGTAATVTITGRAFAPDVVVTAGAGITVSDVTRVGDGTITATVTVPAGTPVGAAEVKVKNPPTGPGFGADDTCTCLQVT